MIRRPPSSTLFPYTPLSRSSHSVKLSRRDLLLAVPAATLIDPMGETRPARADDKVWHHGLSLFGDLKYPAGYFRRSEEHTSELQSRLHLVCRLLLEKKKHPL